MHIDSSKVFFHLGFEKTGSTFLQHEVFPNLIGVKYHRKSKYNSWKKIVSKNPDQKHLFTCETDRSLPRTLDLLAPYLPDARVFFNLRRQDSWLASKYNYHIRKHGFLSLKEFFDLDNDTGFLKKEEFLYRKKIEYIESRLKSKVLYLNYHELSENSLTYVKRITDFLSADLSQKADINRRHKRAFSLKQNRILKVYNSWFPYKHLRTRSKFLNKVWYKYREFLLHTVAFLAQLVPQFMVSKEPLLDNEYLARVRAYYSEDWEYALSRTNFGLVKKPLSEEV